MEDETFLKKLTALSILEIIRQCTVDKQYFCTAVPTFVKETWGGHFRV